MPKRPEYYEAVRQKTIGLERSATATEKEIREAKRPEMNTRPLQILREALRKTNRLTQKLDYMQTMAASWRRWIEGYEALNGARIGRAAFRADWKWIRLWLDLQERLFVEQMLYEKGGFYRTLVTGFKPVG